jgi:UDP-N-acetylglucosamine--N-acetylmuramyl-(pentapeptide) pyrophosphoryl-undecaprenol N-acetylglucosamine transferase
MSNKPSVFFAGGGTGGHIYPAMAVAQKLGSDADICFFCSKRQVDISILRSTPYRYIPLSARPLGANPLFVLSFIRSFFRACFELTKKPNAVVVGVGGFVAAPVVVAARLLGKPLMFINVDIVPGTANRKLARLASKIFVQFESTKDKFGSGSFEVAACGCPLRSEFDEPAAGGILESLELDPARKTLLITGASSGAHNLNMAMKLILNDLAQFKDRWQVVHLSGKGKSGELQSDYDRFGITARVLEYCDDMPALLAAADLAIGRCGAVSVAEFMATDTPAICVPYPYHQDDHQRLNAAEMQKKGGAVIITDHKDDYRQTADELLEELLPLLCDSGRLEKMTESLKAQDKNNAAALIAADILKLR